MNATHVVVVVVDVVVVVVVVVVVAVVLIKAYKNSLTLTNLFETGLNSWLFFNSFSRCGCSCSSCGAVICIQRLKVQRTLMAPRVMSNSVEVSRADWFIDQKASMNRPS